MNTNTHEIIGEAVFETLESRQLLSAVSFRDGVLSVQGQASTANNLSVELSLDGNTIWGVANGQAGTPVQTSTVRQIRIIGGEGNDTINVDPGVKIPVYVQAGSGNDRIRTAYGNDTIKGGNGLDTIDGCQGNDLIYGGNEADSIEGGAGRDSIYGGAGNDWINGDNGNDYVDAGLGRDSITGAAGADVIDNTSGADVAVGSIGNDTIAGDNDDTLRGGPGRDIIIGGVQAVPSAPAPGGTGGVPVGPSQPDRLWIKDFSVINANTGSVVAGLDGVTGNADVNLTALATMELGVRANVSADFTGSVAFTVDSGPEIVKDASSSYTLGASDWDATVGAHTITCRVVGEPKNAQPELLTLNVIRDVPPPPPQQPGGGGTDPNGGPIQPSVGGADSPTPVITALETSVAAGHAVHVNGVESTLKAGTPLTAKYEWDFGDPGSKYNQLRGFNAAHAYDAPGTYTITLSITDEKGAEAVTIQKITITDSARKVLYVSSSGGSDSNSGLSPQQALRTLDKAHTLLGDNTEILLNRGDAFSVSDTFYIKASNVVIGAYGSASARPRINWTGGTGFTPVIETDNSVRDATIEGLSFDKARGHDGIQAGGTNITVRECEFLTIGTAINTNKRPTGVLVQDNTVPLTTTMDGYFAWVEGSDQVYLGNFVANSTRAHGIRDGWADRVLVAYNDLTNLDRRADGDPYDLNIQTLTLHLGNYHYVYNNSFSTGRVEIGPLGGADGLSKPDWKIQRVNWSVVEDNTFHDGSFLDIDHGTNHMMVRGNVFNQSGGNDITVGGYSSTYLRDVEDLTITHNTAINDASSGNFLLVGGPVAGITLTDNLFVAPKLQPGVGQASGVYVVGSDLSSFRQISGNVWPTGKPTSYAQGGVNFVGSSMSSAGYRDASEWDSMPQVGDDTFKDAALGSQSYSLTIGGQAAGSALPMGTRIAA